MRLPDDTTIFLAREPLDFRKSIDGLAMAVGRALGRDPMSGELFVFHNRSRTSIKALYWTPNGFVLLYKRLEQGRIRLPELPPHLSEVTLAPSVLQALLDGSTRVL